MDTAPHSSQSNEEIDPIFEADIEEYLSNVIAQEKENYTSTLQPFSVREQEIRTKSKEALYCFKKSFLNGYQTLINELRHEMNISESKEDLVALATVDPEKFKIFADPEGVTKAFEEGNSIYELLGFTEKTLNIFYHAACRLMESKEFEKARDACYFLVTIAPGVYQFWVALGRCDANLHAYEVALQELSNAIEVDPTEATAYLELIDLLVVMHQFKKATDLYRAGIEFAATHQEKPWAEALRARLEEKMNTSPIPAT